MKIEEAQRMKRMDAKLGVGIFLIILSAMHCRYLYVGKYNTKCLIFLIPAWDSNKKLKFTGHN